MDPAGISSILKLLLVLFLSVKDGPQDTVRGPALEALAPAGVAGYAELDVAQLRTLIRDDPEVAKALFAGRTAEASYGETIEALSQRTRVEPAALREAVARVHTIGLWAMGTTDRKEIRFVAVFDRGNAPDILPKLFGSQPVVGTKAPRTVTYAGRTLYAVERDAREAFWLAEINGRLVLASDVLAAESFLLRTLSATFARPAVQPVAGAGPAASARPLLQVRADVGAVVNGLLPGLSRHDRAEFMAAGSFFDLAAWRGASLVVNKDGIVLRAEIDPGGPLAAALNPPDRLPALLDAIPADAGLALAVGVRDAAKVWDLFEVGFNHVASLGQGAGPREEFIRDFRRETGLDVQTDLISNLVAAAVVVSEPAKGLRLDRGGALFLEGKDPARTLAAVRTLVTHAHKQGNADPEDRQGVKVWRTDEAVIALKGNVVLVSPSRGDAQAQAERMLKHFIEGGESLSRTPAARQSGAMAFATVDAARNLPQAGMERLTAGLTSDAAGITIRVEGGGRNLAAGLLRLMFDVGSKATAQAYQTRTMSSLRQVALACQTYAMEYAKLPASFADLKRYIGDKDAVLRDTRTGQFFQMNPAVAGCSLESIKNPSETVLAYTSPGPEAQPVCVAYCDGSVRLLTRAQFDTALNPPTRTE